MKNQSGAADVDSMQRSGQRRADLVRPVLPRGVAITNPSPMIFSVRWVSPSSTQSLAACSVSRAQHDLVYPESRLVSPQIVSAHNG